MDIDVDEIRVYLENETVVREKLRDEVSEFEKTTRVIVGTLNKIHSTPPEKGRADQPFSTNFRNS